MTKGKKLTELNPALFAKTKPGSKDGKRAPEKMKEVAKIEANIYRFAELLAEVRNATVENVERKQVCNNNHEIENCTTLTQLHSMWEHFHFVPLCPNPSIVTISILVGEIYCLL